MITIFMAVAGIGALFCVIALPVLTVGNVTDARVKLAQAWVSRNGPIGKALEGYEWNIRQYPSTWAGLRALYMDPKVVGVNWRGPYLEGDLPSLLDPWGQPFRYHSPGVHHPEGYDLWSVGPDGVDDNGAAKSDDITNWVK